MKPSFALNLSNERVGLLHRTGRGWLQVGDVAFDTPDLPEALAYLRRTALGLSPRGVTSKLVIPNSQILFIDVEAPGPDDETRRKQIKAGLAGRTPYAPEDLVFDWRGKGTMVKVAVVARETLAEAEAFALEHRFSPVSFVALPDPSQFKGEPYFGPTDAAKTILTKGETIEPDRDAMTVVTRDLPLADLPAAAEDRAERRAKSSDAKRDDASEDRASAGDAGAGDAADPQPTAQLARAEAKTDAPVAEVSATVLDAEAVDPAPPTTPDPEPQAAPEAAPPAPATRDAPFTHVADAGSVTGDSVAMIDDDLPPAPSKAAQIAFASRRSTDDARGDTSPMRAPDKDEPARKAGPELSGAVRNDFRSDFVAKRPVVPLKADAQVTATSIPGSKKRKGAPSTPPPPAVAAAAAALASSGISSGATTKPLTRPGGTFGAKPLPQRGKPRYLGLILTGLLLVLLAIAAAWSSMQTAPENPVSGLQDSGPQDSGLQDSVIADAVPAIDDEMAADEQDAIESAAASDQADDTVAADPVAPPADAPLDQAVAPADLNAPADAVAAGDPDRTATDADVTGATRPAEAVADALSEPPAVVDATVVDPVAVAPDADDPVIAAAPDADLTVATSAAPATLPQAAPDVLADAAEPLAVTPQVVPATAPDLGSGTQAAGLAPNRSDAPSDEIFLATADAPPSFQDALVLPVPALTVDASPAAAPPPPPFGTVYRFGQNGLIVPTDDGILSPEGIMLFAGPPPVVPPARSAAMIAAVAAAVPAPATPASVPIDPAAAVVIAPVPTADPAMAAFRPRPRPDTLVVPAPVENADDASLPAVTDPRQATLRPRVRPQAVAAAGATARQESASASLSAQANAAVEAAVASAAQTGNVMTLAVSRRPAAKPKDMSRAVEAALAVAVRTPEPQPEPEPAASTSADANEPEADEEPELASAAPRIPTKTTVAKQATFANAINLSKINLIGVYGTPSKRYALVRLATGRYKKVSVGDSVDGGRVEAITSSEVRYQKGGRLLSLKMPKA